VVTDIRHHKNYSGILYSFVLMFVFSFDFCQSIISISVPPPKSSPRLTRFSPMHLLLERHPAKCNRYMLVMQFWPCPVHLSEHAREMCLSVSFFTRPAGVCEVKSHRSARRDFEGDDCYYVMKAGDVAFDNPRVATPKVSEALCVEWIGLSLSPSGWTQRFSVAAQWR
jgi:hypothetical protein